MRTLELREAILDKADIGAIGEHLVTVELLRRGIEVSVPVVDRGIDLIAFKTAPLLRAVPLQVKATPSANFTIHRAWEQIPGLVLVYVFDVATRPIFNIMDYADAFRLASSWTDLSDKVAWNDPKRGNHDWSSLNAARRAEIARFADRWDLVLDALAGK